MDQPYLDTMLIIPNAECRNGGVVAVGFINFAGYLARAILRFVTLLAQRPSVSIQQRLPIFLRIALPGRDSMVFSHYGSCYFCRRYVASMCS